MIKINKTVVLTTNPHLKTGVDSTPETLCEKHFRTGVFNLLSSRANLHLSYNPAGRSHCILQNHHEYIKHHHRGMSGSPGDEGEVSMT